MKTLAPRFILLIAACVAGFVAPPAYAEHANGQQLAPRIHGEIYTTPPKGNDPRVSVTTGWREISGWQKSVIDRDKNLRHWNWLPMQEMNKGYVKLKPGSVRPKGRPGPQPTVARKPQYVKPVHVATVVPVHPRQPVVSQIPAQAPPPHYVKPIHVATDLSGKIHAPSTTIFLAAPKTNLSLSAPTTSLKLAAPQTKATIGVPQVGAKLAAKNTNAQLVSKPQVKEPPSVPVGHDEMSDAAGKPADADTFQDPSLEQRNSYGAVKHPATTYGGIRANSNVHAKVLRKHH